MFETWPLSIDLTSYPCTNHVLFTLICKRRIVHGELLYADNVHDRISVQDYIGYMQQC